MIGFGVSSFESLSLELFRGDQLNLHGNSFTSLRGLPEMKTLTDLNLSSNFFETMDLKELSFLPNINILDLSGNRIKGLDDAPFLPTLKILRISFNLISNLSGIHNFANLEILDCRGNQLKHTSDCLNIQALGNLQEITLASSDGRHANPICSYPKDIVTLFDATMYFGTINGKNRLLWSTEIGQLSTPRIDKVFRNFADRLLQNSENPGAVNRPLNDGKNNNKMFKLINVFVGFLRCSFLYRVIRVYYKSMLRRRWSCWRQHVEVESIITKQREKFEEKLSAVTEAIVIEESSKRESLAMKLATVTSELAVLKAETLESKSLLISEVSRLEERLQLENERRNEACNQLVKALDNSAEQTAELTRMRNSVACLTGDIIIKNREADIHCATIRKLEFALEEAKRLHSEALDGKKQLAISWKDTQEDVENLKKAGEILKSSLACAEEEIAILKLRNRQLEDESQRSSAAIQSLTSEKISFSEKFTAKSVELEQCKTELNELLLAHIRLGALSDSVTEEKNKLLHELKGLHQEHIGLKNDFVALQILSTSKTKDVEDLCVIVQELKASLGAEHNKCRLYETQQLEWRLKLEKMLKANEIMKNVVSETRRECLKRSSQCSELMTDIGDLKAERDDLLSRIQKYETELVCSNAALDESKNGDAKILLKVIEDLKGEINFKSKSLDCHLAEARNIRQKLERRLSASERVVKELKIQLSGANNEIAELRDNLGASLKAQSDLESFLCSLNIENEIRVVGTSDALSSMLNNHDLHS
jgi:hypothetical protein